jgi:heat shock protein HtpX
MTRRRDDRGPVGGTLVTALVLGLAMALLASLVTAVLVALPWVDPGVATLLAFVLALTVGLGYGTYRVGTRRLLAGLNPRRLSRRRYPEVHRRFDRLAADLGVVEPRLLVADVGAPNALSFGGRRGGRVVVDPRLLGLLTHDELAGVLAHELAHLRSRDSAVQSVAYSLVRTVGTAVSLVVLPVVVVAIVLRRVWNLVLGRPTRPPRRDLAAVRYRTLQATVVVLLALTAVTRAFSRRREYRADDRAAAATGEPLALARALRKIDRAATARADLLGQLTISGDEEGTLMRLLATHPPMDERIERLRERADRERGAVEVPIR